MYKFWMVLVEGSQGCKYAHRTAKDAQKEAERLARMTENIGRAVFILEATSYAKCEPPPVIFTDLSDMAPEIPF